MLLNYGCLAFALRKKYKLINGKIYMLVMPWRFSIDNYCFVVKPAANLRIARHSAWPLH